MARMLACNAARFLIACALAGAVLAPAPAVAQAAGAAAGEWRYIGGDAGHARYSGLDQINAGNFEELEVAWGLARRQLRAGRAGRFARHAHLR